MGDNFSEVALALFVLALTKNNVAALGVVLAMVYLPRVALGWLVAGIIDRLPPRAVLLAGDVARAALVLSVPGVRSYPWTVAAVFLMYGITMVYQPLVRALQPEIAASPEVNQKSAARQHSYYAIADLGAYLAAAGVLALWGVAPAFAIDAATYLGAAALIQTLRVNPTIWTAPKAGESRFWEDIREGYRYVKAASPQRMVILLSSAAALGVAALNTLLAPLSRAIWHVSSAHYVWLLLSIASGSLASSIVIERWRVMEHYPFHLLLGTGFFLTGLGFGTVLILPHWWLGAVSLMFAGAGNALYGTALIAWMQQRTPFAVRARILSIRGMGMGVGGAVGALAAGWLAGGVGLGPTVAAVAVLWSAIAAWAIASHSLLTSGDAAAAAL